MDQLNSHVLAGLGLLAVVSLLAVPREGRVGTTLATFVVGLVLVLAGIRWTSNEAGYFPLTHALRLVAGAERELKAAIADPAVSRILLFEGSSYSARGLDGHLVAREFSEQTGVGTASVQLTLDGSNHFERYWMLSIVISRLDQAQREALRRKELVLMMEIQSRYDLDPLNNFTRNERTYRTYAYMGPGNALAALHSLALNGTGKPATALAVLEHVAINMSSLGGFRRMSRIDGLRVSPGYLPLDGSKAGYRYKKGPRVQAALRHVAAWRREDRLVAMAGKELAWIGPVRIARFDDLLDGMLDRRMFYAVASADPADVYHVATFCAVRQDGACLDYEDAGLMSSLDGSAYWNDDRHLTRAGARVFSHWFAGRLAAGFGAESAR